LPSGPTQKVEEIAKKDLVNTQDYFQVMFNSTFLANLRLFRVLICWLFLIDFLGQAALLRRA